MYVNFKNILFSVMRQKFSWQQAIWLQHKYDTLFVHLCFQIQQTGVLQLISALIFHVECLLQKFSGV